MERSLSKTNNGFPLMGEAEARTLTEQIKNSVDQIRGHLLAIYLGQGWMALGYSSFGQYLDQEFNQSVSYLRRQTYAALLEAELAEGNELVGQHRESHLRPLNEIFGEDTAGKVLAYHLALDEEKEPIARDFRRVASWVYVHKNGDARISERLKAGSLGPLVAYELCKWAEEFRESGDDDLLLVTRECSDVALIPILVKLKRNKAETWSEIFHSGTIPAFPEPIPLEKATAYSLLAWLDVASAEHRAVARMARQSLWDERKAALDEVLLVLDEFLSATGIKSRAEMEVRLRSAYRRYQDVQQTKGTRDED